MTPRSRSGRALQVAALVLAALGVVSQLAGFAHLAYVRHVTCAEHGELIEAGAPAAVAPPDAAETRMGAVASVAEHGHDHCAVALHRRQQARRTSVDELVSRAPEPAAPPHLEPRSAVLSIAVFLVAPKNSPPA
jgi:hypothetical protein